MGCIVHAKYSYLILIIASFSSSLLTSLQASTFISDAIFGASLSTTQRQLLQTTKPCPVSFEFENYTILTSQCKGPSYPPSTCCSAFKQIVCPHVDEFNDLSTNCATNLFSYIALYGYPKGLFASLCREDKSGLVCPEQPPQSSPPAEKVSSSNNGRFVSSNFLVLTLVATTLLFFNLM